MVDATAPVITAPAGVWAEGTGPAGTAVALGVPIGETTAVACGATDPSGNTASCGLSIRVLSCDELAESLEARADGLGLNRGNTGSILDRLRNVRRSIAASMRVPACAETENLLTSLASWVTADQLESELAEPYLASLTRLAACIPCAD